MAVRAMAHLLLKQFTNVSKQTRIISYCECICRGHCGQPLVDTMVAHGITLLLNRLLCDLMACGSSQGPGFLFVQCVEPNSYARDAHDQGQTYPPKLFYGQQIDDVTKAVISVC